ncbi:MAG: dephospho-CoA kinase [Acidimicrobiia bacterium]
MKAEPTRVLLSGGIGSGKTSAGELLTELGALVIDADRVGHEVLEAEAFASVAGRWPQAVREGAIDRRRLADVVFAGRGELAALEELTHPAIRRRIEELVSRADEPVVVVQVPILTDLLGEGWIRVVVDAPEEVREARLEGRGMSREDIHRRMAAQPGRQQWRAGADYLLDNSGDRDDLRREIERLWQWLSAKPSQTPGPLGPAPPR